MRIFSCLCNGIQFAIEWVSEFLITMCRSACLYTFFFYLLAILLVYLSSFDIFFVQCCQMSGRRCYSKYYAVELTNSTISTRCLCIPFMSTVLWCFKCTNFQCARHFVVHFMLCACNHIDVNKCFILSLSLFRS